MVLDSLATECKKAFDQDITKAMTDVKDIFDKQTKQCKERAQSLDPTDLSIGEKAEQERMSKWQALEPIIGQLQRAGSCYIVAEAVKDYCIAAMGKRCQISQDSPDCIAHYTDLFTFSFCSLIWLLWRLNSNK